jgi:malate dehydrogenase (oxaloacetate-decarboxylating)
VKASGISDEMCIAASLELSSCIPESKLKPDMILPLMDNPEIAPRIAAAVGARAVSQKLAAVKLSREQIYTGAKKVIARSRSITETMMAKGLIKKGR